MTTTKIWRGPQGELVEITEKLPNSALAAGTLRGPQGEIILPPCEDGKCPTCGQDFPDSEDELEDDRDDITEFL
jgi:DNA repair exonuclease SbcCD ATPase subunit